MNAKDVFLLFKETFKEWSEDKVPRLGAALAYYTVFSLPPILFIAITIVGAAFGQEAAQGKIVEQIQWLIGREGARSVETMIENARQLPTTSILATVVGLVTLLVGALGAFSQLQDALDTIWEVAPKPGQGFKDVIENRFISFTMVLGVGFLLLVSLVISAGLTALTRFVGGWLPDFAILIALVNFVIPFVVITLLFALIFKVLPDVTLTWGDVWPGAMLTAFLFTVGKFLIGLYLGNSQIGSAYGAAGSLIILLVWIYYSAQILLFGAEFTQVYVKRFGSHRVVPTDNAIPLTERARAQQGIPHTETLKSKHSFGWLRRRRGAATRRATASGSTGSKNIPLSR
jgi:membrane protein